MHNSYFGLRSAPLTAEALFALMAEHGYEPAEKSNNGAGALRLFMDGKRLSAAYSKASSMDVSDFAATWLCDNYHLLERTQKELEEVWPRQKALPSMGAGEQKGLPRVYRIAAEVTGHCEGRVTKDAIIGAVNAYQIENPLLMDEIWALLPAFLSALLKLCSMECVGMLRRMNKRKQAEETAKRLKEQPQEAALVTIRRSPLDDPQFTAKLTELLRGTDEATLLYSRMERQGKDIHALSTTAHKAELKSGHVFENAIESVKRLNELEWETVFRAVSDVDKTLSKDVVYDLSDDRTRRYYLDCVKRTAKREKTSETMVAKVALALSCRQNDDARKSHVGYYLADEGKKELKRQLSENGRKGVPVLSPEEDDGLEPTDDVLKAVASGKKKLSENGKRLLFYMASIFVISQLLLLLCGIANGTIWAFVIGIPASVPSWTLAQDAVRRVLSRLPVRHVPRLALADGIPDSCRTAVVLPVLVNSAKSARKLIEKLEVNYYACGKERNVYYCLLADLPQSDLPTAQEDAEIKAELTKACERLNQKHGNTEKLFFVLVRERSKNAEGVYTGKERKRGALGCFNEFILNGKCGEFWEVPKDFPAGVRFVLTLDADTRMPIGAARQLIGALAHPLNAPTSKEGKLTGHAIIAPALEFTASGANRSEYARLFSGNAGLDSYASSVSEVYQDLFGEGNYCGKGIYDVAAFEKCMGGKIKQNTVLSHDLLEGCFCHAAYKSDVALYEDYPSRYLSAAARSHRWMRGDWQLLPYALTAKSLSPLSRYKLMDNIRRALLMPASALLLLVAPFVAGGWTYALLTLIALTFGSLVELIVEIKRSRDARTKLNESINGLWNTVWRALFTLSVVPYEGWIGLTAAVKSLWRMFVSHKNMLEWVTAADAEKLSATTVTGHYRAMLAAPVMGTLLAVSGILSGAWASLALALMWWLAPYAASALSQPKRERLKKNAAEYLKSVADDTWRCFSLLCKQNGIPSDNVQISPKKPAAERTSPTNIGMALLARLSAFSLGLIDKEELCAQTDNAVKAMERAEKWNGHLYNWMETVSLSPLTPKFVSSVDSGNLAACLIATRQFLTEMGEELIPSRIEGLLADMDFSKLYDNNRRLFYVGYDATSEKMSDGHYDMLASESRILSLVAVARSYVEPTHWFKLARPLTAIDGRRLLISWSGTMFEYMMPVLFTGAEKGTLLGESVENSLYAQRRCERGKPWGVSESGFYAFDISMNYAYKAFGTIGTGVKPSVNDSVVAPYATALASMADHVTASDNLRKLEGLGARGDLGFFEAVDFTRSRVGDEGMKVVKSYMAHHQGMTLASIANLLTGGRIQNAFMSAPEIRAASLLLEEKLPDRTIVIRDYIRRQRPLHALPAGEILTKHTVKKGELEAIALFGGADVTVRSDGVTSAAFEHRGKKLMIYPQEGDRLTAGVYIQDEKTSEAVPINQRAVFEQHKASFSAELNGVTAIMEICSPPEERTELRIIRLKNNTEHSVKIRIHCFAEVALATERDFGAHKAFQKLFAGADALDERTLRFVKNDRKGEERAALCAAILGGNNRVTMGTDRFEVFGRMQNSPRFLKNVVLKTKSAPIEPCAYLSCETELARHGEECFAFALCAGTEEEAEAAAKSYENTQDAERKLGLCKTYAQVRLRHLCADGADCERMRKLMQGLLIKTPPDNKRLAALKANKLGKEGLWRLSISGDLPIVVLSVSKPDELNRAKELMKLKDYALSLGHEFDAIIIDDEESGYARPVMDALVELSAGRQRVTLLAKDDISPEERRLLFAYCAYGAHSSTDIAEV